MGEFRKDLVPSPEVFFENRGMVLFGRGKWRTTECEFHGGSDSARVNTETGAFVCMNCGVKAGDVVAYAMQADGTDFVTAARSLGAWVDTDKPYQRKDRPRAFSARDAVEVIALELPHSLVIISDVRRGVLPTEEQWDRWLIGVGRLESIAHEFRT